MEREEFLEHIRVVVVVLRVPQHRPLRLQTPVQGVFGVKPRQVLDARGRGKVRGVELETQEVEVGVVGVNTVHDDRFREDTGLRL